MNIKNVTAWNTKPASRMWFGFVGSLRFEYATPISAAPTICITVATTSQVMKIQSISFGRRGAWRDPSGVARIRTDSKV